MELKLPEIGENISQGTVTKILVKAGDSIKKGQNILELETDKAVVEIPSNMDGIVGEILIKAGAVIKVGQPVFKMQTTSSPKVSVGDPDTSQTVDTRRTTVSVQQEGQKHSGMTEDKSAAALVTTNIPLSGSISDMKLPPLGENLEKGTVTKILVKANDAIKKGQNILELETDKAVLEVPSPSDALIKEILIKNGAVIKVGEPIFKVLAGTSSVIASALPAGRQEAKQSIKPEEIASSPSAPRNDTKATAPIQSMVGHMPVRKNVPAAPSVRLFAREIGIDIGQVPGSGPGGRISIDDVKRFAKAIITGGVQAQSTPAIKPLPDFSKWGNSKREAMSNVRKKTAEHLSSAWNTIPHVTQFEKADVTELEKMRKSASTEQRKLSITSYLIKIIAIGLKQFPQFNASVDMATNEIVFKEFINIGVAVDTDRGLLVPVLKNVDRMNVGQISDELISMAERARNRKTGIEDLQGGTFTISNLGGIGGSFFTPIVNWPEVAILGVSRGVMEPVYINGTFLPRLMLPLSLSYDHRLIDGADGARFIRWLAKALENPSTVEGLNV